MACYTRFLLLILFHLMFTVSQAQRKDTLINAYFDFNSDRVSDVQNNILEPLFPRILYVKKVTGFADSTGSDRYNLILSRKRAESISEVFKALNIPFDHEVAYNGKDNSKSPVWRNRRVEIIAVLRDTQLVSVSSIPKVVASMDLDNIYFVPDMARITEESLPYVDQLAKRLLNDYKTGHFNIIGHVNYQSNKDSFELRDLYMLSERRAKAVYELLLQKGIPADRMTYRGVGNSQPVVEHPVTDEEKRKNMRVQIIVTR